MTTTCPNCKKNYTPALSSQPLELLRRWQSGELIQNVFPNSTNEHREQLISGLCSDKCFDKFLGVN